MNIYIEIFRVYWGYLAYTSDRIYIYRDVCIYVYVYDCRYMHEYVLMLCIYVDIYEFVYIDI
jgi:hypothetical protein